MSSLPVKEAVWAILDDEWETTRVLDLDNTAPSADAEMTPWVAPQFMGTTEEQIGLGDSTSRYWRERGFVHLLVAVPSRSGWRTCDTLARSLGLLFRARQTSAELVFGAVSPPQTYTEDEAILGNWSIKAFLVDYIYTYQDPTEEVA